MNYEHEIIEITKIYTGKIPQSDIDSILSLASNNECGAALENLCIQIYEYDLQVSKDIFNRIEKMIEAMNLDSNYINDLKELIIE